MVIYAGKLLRKNCLFFIFFLTIFSNSDNLQGQENIYNYYYRIYFTDKGKNDIAAYLPGQLFSERAIKRRLQSGLNALDHTDIPVSREYIDRISDLGLKFHCASKWMNTAVFKTESLFDTGLLLSLPFVANVKVVKRPAAKNLPDKLKMPVLSAEIMPYERPISMLNGFPLHQSGFVGTGILIAILDGGFLYADIASSLLDLRDRNGIKATFDFVNRSKKVYDYHNHGTSVLSVIAGKKEGSIAGTAQGADFLLLRTEDTFSEFPVEEDFWVAGAEYADSAGTDVISSSLGYFIFDDPSMDYKYSDLDGETAFITRAAGLAASKGIMVFNSAGNERDNPWRHIIAPADARNVIAVGAVDALNSISSFSSAGPAADGRIKPDNTAMGVAIPVQTDQYGIKLSSGTSFSCPVLSGMTACLMQAFPGASNSDLRDVLHSSGDRFANPDSLYGYGTPDMSEAYAKLYREHPVKSVDEAVISPNPSTGSIKISFLLNPQQVDLEIYSLSGRSLFRKSYRNITGRTIFLDEFSAMDQGMYIVRLTTENGTFVHKVVKLND